MTSKKHEAEHGHGHGHMEGPPADEDKAELAEKLPSELPHRTPPPDARFVPDGARVVDYPGLIRFRAQAIGAGYPGQYIVAHNILDAEKYYRQQNGLDFFHHVAVSVIQMED
jgi:hypothetical protein